MPNRTHRLRAALALALACAGAAALGGCFPTPRPSDAGGESFSRQIVPKLQGRKAGGYDEVKLLDDIANAIGGARGREAVVNALMREDDYVTHWEEVLGDQLRVARGGSQSHLGCYNDTAAAPASLTDALARSVRDNAATASVAGGATMTSLLRSSLRLDNLSPALRAHLFAFGSKPITGADIVEENRRSDFVRNFNDSYIDRDLGCLSCHNSAWSISGEQTGWDRTWPVLGYFEKALFNSHSGTTPEAEGVIFRQDARFGGSAPFGLTTSCGTYVASSTLPAGSPNAVFGDASDADPARTTVRDLEASLARGVAKLQNGLNRTAGTCASSCDGCPGANDGDADLNTKREAARQRLTASCSNGCHGGVSGGFKPALQAAHASNANWDDAIVRGTSGTHTYVVPNDPSDSWIYQRVQAGEMPPGGLAEPARTNFLNAWAAYINALPSSDGCDACEGVVCDGVNREIDPDEAFAFLTAQKVANTAFEHVFGRKLTIPNRFARSSPELGALWNLTEFTLIPGGTGGGWSLRAPLRKLVTSRLFNRLSPRHADGSEPYEVPNVLDPWTEGDPRVGPRDPDEEYNAMTEGVHRHPAETLLRSTSRALGWPEKARFGSTGSYPDINLVQATGAYIENARPGFNTVDFQGLLHWETVHGACDKAAAGVSGDDFVDELMGHVAAWPAAHGGAQPTYRDAVLALKDRILSYPHIDASFDDESGRNEEKVLADYFGVADLADPVVPGTLEHKLRGYCGVLVESPQYLLAGIEPTDLGERPALLPGRYQARCAQLRPLLDFDNGYKMICLEGSVLFLPFPHVVIDTLGPICPYGSCQIIPWEPQVCFKEPWSCSKDLPICDPTNPDLGGCGTPIDSIPADFSGGLSAKLGGATIIKASKVLIFRAAKKFEPEPAKGGTVLAPGDWLQLPAESFLAVKDENGKEYATNKPVKPREGKLEGQPHWLQVSGEPEKLPKNPLAELTVGKEYPYVLMQHPSRAWGEGGPRLPLDTMVPWDIKATLSRLKKGEDSDWVFKHPEQLPLGEPGDDKQ